MKLLAENQLVGTSPGWAVFRNLYEKSNGERVSVRTSQEFEVAKERRAYGKNGAHPATSETFSRHKL